MYRKECVDLFSQSGSGERPVRIAVLDSGMNDRDLIVESNVERITYRDFVRGQHDAPCDLASHGTHTAAIVLGIAKNAKLLVGRVVEELHFQDPGSIAKVCIQMGLQFRPKDLTPG